MSNIIIPYKKNQEITMSKVILKLKSKDPEFRYKIDRRNKEENKLIITKHSTYVGLRLLCSLAIVLSEKLKDESK